MMMKFVDFLLEFRLQVFLLSMVSDLKKLYHLNGYFYHLFYHHPFCYHYDHFNNDSNCISPPFLYQQHRHQTPSMVCYKTFYYCYWYSLPVVIHYALPLLGFNSFSLTFFKAPFYLTTSISLVNHK